MIFPETALITDENRDLIGKDACLTWTVYDKDGNYVRGTAPEPTQDIFGDSKIITSARRTPPFSRLVHMSAK